MGSARDGSPDPTRASNSARLLQSIRSRLPDHSGAVGSKHVKIAVVYTHVLNRGGRGVRSPVDSLGAPLVSGVIGGNGITPQ